MEKPSFANSAVRVGFRSSAVRVGFRVLKNGKIPKIRSGGLPKNGKPRNQDSFGWASEERKPKDSFVCELPRIRKRRTKVRLASETKIQRRTEKTKIRFGGLLKNEKELRFELWGFLSLFPLTFPLLFLERINQRLGIEINSFALPESNCFGFLIPDDRID
ncbi:uncharacterized protein OCT59_008583 [Rhizophagus irregularis]|uniref:uncharacterized protein n=1 Tax=Rhizophagus irregularis TaxID=588596 RepID=UPI00332B8643|nr:hypothetical protein OCT59_008583 [Rhizophagus irregularis]